MVIRNYLFLLLFISCCYLEQESKIELLIEKLDIQKNNIVVILVDKTSESNINQKIKFRQKLIRACPKTSLY
jgi:hypothetical protein